MNFNKCLLLIALAAVGAGCGGGGGASTEKSAATKGSATISVVWPKEKSRLIPDGASKIILNLLNTTTGVAAPDTTLTPTDIGTVTLPDQYGKRVGTKKISNLTPGIYKVTANAYHPTGPLVDGPSLSTGTSSFTIVAGQDSQFTVAMISQANAMLFTIPGQPTIPAVAVVSGTSGPIQIPLGTPMSKIVCSPQAATTGSSPTLFLLSGDVKGTLNGTVSSLTQVASGAFQSANTTFDKAGPATFTVTYTDNDGNSKPYTLNINVKAPTFGGVSNLFSAPTGAKITGLDVDYTTGKPAVLLQNLVSTRDDVLDLSSGSQALVANNKNEDLTTLSAFLAGPLVIANKSGGDIYATTSLAPTNPWTESLLGTGAHLSDVRSTLVGGASIDYLLDTANTPPNVLSFNVSAATHLGSTGWAIANLDSIAPLFTFATTTSAAKNLIFALSGTPASQVSLLGSPNQSIATVPTTSTAIAGESIVASPATSTRLLYVLDNAAAPAAPTVHVLDLAGEDVAPVPLITGHTYSQIRVINGNIFALWKDAAGNYGVDEVDHHR